tara:strand:- start:922 stop:1419 length:498 start_codon:yes stop_codon:yes gene_type:complete
VKNFFLLGMPASGKSTIANYISEKTNLYKIDLDEEIEKYCESSIINIFNTKGEIYFRKIESLILKKIILEKKNYILSTGGGSPCHNNNLNIILKNGISIFINTPISTIVERIIRNTNRPMFKNKNNIRSKINELYQARLCFYNQSDYIISKKFKKEILSIIKIQS